ncbi:MAG: hypothetical protein EXS64_18180 [Candidatus Latescibacteria bacterium]|nr:hypothetical protein [Candidatus Latescibacterota bacterium]
MLRRCFCQVPRDRLELLARQKYVQGNATVDLVKKTSSPVEREEMMAVCLLNLSPEKLRGILSRDPEEVVQHVLQCQQDALRYLHERGIEVTPGEPKDEPKA